MYMVAPTPATSPPPHTSNNNIVISFYTITSSPLYFVVIFAFATANSSALAPQMRLQPICAVVVADFIIIFVVAIAVIADEADEALYKQCNKIQLFSVTSCILFRLLFVVRLTGWYEYSVVHNSKEWIGFECTTPHNDSSLFIHTYIHMYVYNKTAATLSPSAANE
ncbi:hypothetical protein FF38_13236 [Lucilia cuprina]|uniref:Uncharacterized protein n=1 Tax=Lucilia cuprina TaxID=7375 RepID=A0A0L0BU87_LUCCU|nr:hypothetical protein FF38_13236 [Lucilia cuprina]